MFMINSDIFYENSNGEILSVYENQTLTIMHVLQSDRVVDAHVYQLFVTVW